MSQLNSRSGWAGARFCTWTLDTGETLRLAVMDSGRYLGLDRGKGGVWFLRLLNLHQTPRARWRGKLEAVLEQMDEADFTPVSAFPWGGSVLHRAQRPQRGPAGLLQPRRTVLRAHPQSHRGDRLETPGAARQRHPVLQIHEQAAAAGWRIAGATQAPFLPGILVVTLARTGDRTGHWA